jgi:hypothetical protein
MLRSRRRAACHSGGAPIANHTLDSNVILSTNSFSQVLKGYLGAEQLYCEQVVMVRFDVDA